MGIYVCLFVKHMSANELENLMSQLHTNSQMQFQTHNIGIKIDDDDDDKEWTYEELEKKYTRDGRLRGISKNKQFIARELKELRKSKNQKYYIPDFGKFVVDEDGNELQKPVFKIVNDKVEWTNVQLDLHWKTLFWNEHWRCQAILDKYYNSKKYVKRLEEITKKQAAEYKAVCAKLESATGNQVNTQVHTSHGGAAGGGAAPVHTSGNITTKPGGTAPARPPLSRYPAPTGTARRSSRDAEIEDAFTSKPKGGNPNNYLTDDPARGASKKKAKK